MPASIALVFLGGGLGSVARYLVSLAAARLFGDEFAWGTLAVNLAGCFLIGLAVGLAERSILSREFRIFFVTGVLGGLTTFSTFSFESTRYFAGGEYLKAGADVAANVIVGLALAAAGLAAAARA